MTVMITMANEGLIQECNICEAYRLAQSQIYGLTYSVSRRLVGSNPENKKKEAEEHLKKVQKNGDVPVHIWHGNQAGIVGHAHYGTSIWGKDGEHFPTEPTMEVKQKMDVMKKEEANATRANLLTERWQKWVRNTDEDTRRGVSIDSPLISMQTLYPEEKPTPPNHGVIVIPQTNRHNKEGFQECQRVFGVTC